MDNLFLLFFDLAFVHNVVLVQFLGICSFLGVSKNTRNSLGMSAAVSFVMILSSILSWLIFKFLLVPLGLVYLKTLVFILAIATLVQLVEMFIKKKYPPLYKNMGVFLPLITTNCTILGIVLINIQQEYTLTASVVNAIGTSLGYAFAIVLFSFLRARLEAVAAPKCMQGLPLALLVTSCMSIALMGLAGIH